MVAILDGLEEFLVNAREQQGWLQPHSSGSVAFSNLSGPAVNVPADDLRYDKQGRPHLPADNSAYLGRSLFTDYLLPVELAGFLLLVATVGSIAIAQRRTPTENAE